MAFVALNPKGERICSLDHGDLRKIYKKGDFTCPLCGESLIYHHGTQKKSHFGESA